MNQLQISSNTDIPHFKKVLRNYIIKSLNKSINTLKRSASNKVLSPSKVANLLNLERSDVTKLLNGSQNWSLEKLMDVCLKLGIEIQFEVGKKKDKRTFNIS